MMEYWKENDEMKLLVFVLNMHERLDALLTEFAHKGIGGATILESTGMAEVLQDHDEEDIPFLGSLRSLLNPEREKSDTIFLVLHEEKVSEAVQIFEQMVGNLNNKNTGIAFSLPVDFVKGIPNLE